MNAVVTRARVTSLKFTAFDTAILTRRPVRVRSSGRPSVGFPAAPAAPIPGLETHIHVPSLDSTCRSAKIPLAGTPYGPVAAALRHRPVDSYRFEDNTSALSHDRSDGVGDDTLMFRVLPVCQVVVARVEIHGDGEVEVVVAHPYVGAEPGVAYLRNDLTQAEEGFGDLLFLIFRRVRCPPDEDDLSDHDLLQGQPNESRLRPRLSRIA